MLATIDVRGTYGAVLLGCFIAVALSGILAFQACIYFRLYPSDKPVYKFMVAVVWMLDVTHTCLICASAWTYLISNFGNVEVQLQAGIPTTIGYSEAVSACVILITHLFYLQRLMRLSHNWFIVVPTFILVLGRLSCSLVLTVTATRLQNLFAFNSRYYASIMFYLELGFSSAADVIITSGMCFYLQGSRRGFGTMNNVLDSIILYTVNSGTLTCMSTIASLICAYIMSNFVFLALHFVIAKLYANSLFAMLNMRKSFRARVVSPDVAVNQMPVLSPRSLNLNNHGERIRSGSLDFIQVDTIEIKAPQIAMEKMVQCNDDRESGPPSSQISPVAFELKGIDGAGTAV